MSYFNLKKISADERLALEQEAEKRAAGKNILLIEDNEALGSQLQTLLEAITDNKAKVYRVKTVEEGREFIEMFKDEPAELKNTYVITDDNTQSPMSGGDLIRWLRHQEDPVLQQLPVMLFTGTISPEDGVEENTLTLRDPYTAISGKPMALHVLGKAFQELDANKEVHLADDELQRRYDAAERHYDDLKKIHANRERQGRIVSRAEDRIWDKDRNATLEAMGTYRKEIERRRNQANVSHHHL